MLKKHTTWFPSIVASDSLRKKEKSCVNLEYGLQIVLEALISANLVQGNKNQDKQF
jgi:hypothetical protein